MLILLPPSETKRDGGVGAPLDIGALSFPALHPVRRRIVADLVRLSRDAFALSAALKLGPNQQEHVRRVRLLRRSATMPALDRYAGVLYDAIGVGALDAPARSFAAEHLLIHSALFGLIGADDAIPAYRFSHDSRLPGHDLRAEWAGPTARQLAGSDGLILDLRSAAYAILGPLPDAPRAWTLRVVAPDDHGGHRVLSHFNKKSKGLLVRELLSAGIDHPDVDSLLAWAQGAGIDLRPGDGRELELVARG
ncbi:MAG: YaaA family protein [Microbacteriaceae bacterium]